MKQLGWLYYKMGNLNESERILNEYLKLTEETDDKSMAEVYYHLGMLYFSKNEFQKAEAFFNKAYKNFPDSYFGRVSYEHLKYKLGKVE